MSCKHVVALAAAVSIPVALAQADMKGRMKEGLYEVKMEMEMPGMPAGMGKQSMTMQNCVTAKDIETGAIARPKEQKPGDCELKDFKMSGSTATYTTVCKDMTADTKMTFRDGGYTMDTKVAMKQGGQTMNMTQKMEGRYVGPCK